METRIALVMLLGLGSCFGEGVCFRTASQAAVQVGEAEGGGYRLEFVRVDRFDGRTWAGVRSCVHPEWPVVLVAGTPLPHFSFAKAAAATTGADVVGGKQVRVVESDSMVRLEMTGVAMGSGQVGEKVWVRIPGPDGNTRLALGLVQGKDVLEIGR